MDNSRLDIGSRGLKRGFVLHGIYPGIYFKDDLQFVLKPDVIAGEKHSTNEKSLIHFLSIKKTNKGFR